MLQKYWLQYIYSVHGQSTTQNYDNRRKSGVLNVHPKLNLIASHTWSHSLRDNVNDEI